MKNLEEEKEGNAIYILSESTICTTSVQKKIFFYNFFATKINNQINEVAKML